MSQVASGNLFIMVAKTELGFHLRFQINLV
jgi:hypothetical protein